MQKPLECSLNVTSHEDDCGVVVEELTHCPLCQSERIKPFATSYDRLCLTSRQEFRYSRCVDCDLIFQSRRPIESEIHHFYPSEYGPYKPQAGGDDGAVVANTGLRRLVRNVAQRIGQIASRIEGKIWPNRFQQRYWQPYQPQSAGQTLLDFGCGSDAFLNHARRRGWDTTGVDFSPQAVESARGSGHKAYLLSDQLWKSLPDQSFDLVRMSHVLEHLYDPLDILRRLASKMKPGGVIHIALPNPQSLSARLFGARWFSLDSPRHIMLFTPARLRQLLVEAGFENVSVLHEPLTKDIARSLAYVLIERGWIKHATIHQCIGNPLLDGLLSVPMRLVGLMLGGDRFHMYAHRQEIAEVRRSKAA